MTNRSEIKSLVDQYFSALLTDDVSNLPLTDDVEMKGTMQSEPVRGEADVRSHLEQVAPFMQNERYSRLIIEGDSAAALNEFDGVNGVKGKGTIYFDMKDGKIHRIESVLDTRPFFAGK
jgi:hypothetical protein